jgi:hypothetical protein
MLPTVLCFDMKGAKIVAYALLMSGVQEQLRDDGIVKLRMVVVAAARLALRNSFSASW